MRIWLLLLLIPASATAQERAGALDVFGWRERGVETRGPTVRFTLARPAAVTIIRWLEDEAPVLVLSARYEAGSHSERITNRTADGMTNRAPFGIDCSRNPQLCSGSSAMGAPSTRVRAGVQSSGRRTEYYIVIAADSAIGEQAIITRLRAAGSLPPDSVASLLPPMLLGPVPDSAWAAVRVRR